ncbi:hypothetical protein D9M71_427950 [compost metagenome]
MTIKVLRMDRQGAQLRLKAKEFERDVALPIPELPPLKKGKPLTVSFAFDNPEARKAFSFHLLAEGRGVIEISDFRVTTEPLSTPAVAADDRGQVAQKRPLHPITTFFGLLARQQDALEGELENPGEERAVLPQSTELRLQQYH